MKCSLFVTGNKFLNWSEVLRSVCRHSFWILISFGWSLTSLTSFMLVRIISKLNNISRTVFPTFYILCTHNKSLITIFTMVKERICICFMSRIEFKMCFSNYALLVRSVFNCLTLQLYRTCPSKASHVEWLFMKHE